MNSPGRLGLAALALTLLACSPAPGATPTIVPSPTAPPSAAPSAPPVSAAPAEVAGRTFLSTARSIDGAPADLVPGTRIRLIFGDDGNLSAQAGCNTIGGTYAVDGDVLFFSGGGMTEMGCDPARHAQDEWLVSFLGSQPALALASDNLTLTSGKTVISLLDREVAEPDRPLAGTTWSLEALIYGDAVASMPAGVTASIAFADDGSFQINDGCNSGGGLYQVDGDSIRFAEVVLTEMACAGPAGQVEQHVLNVLGGEAVTYAIDASSLNLQAGPNGLQFVALTTP